MGQRLRTMVRKDGKAKGYAIRTNTPSAKQTLIDMLKNENDDNYENSSKDNWLAKLLKSFGSSSSKN